MKEKKREFEDLQNFSQGLIDENNMLRRELDLKNKEINWLKNQIGKVCNNCSRYFTKDKNSLQTFGRNSAYFKYGLVTSLLVVICLIGTCLWDDNSYESRALVFADEVDKRIMMQNLTLPANEDKTNEYNNYLPKTFENSLQIPFKDVVYNENKNNNVKTSSINIDLTGLSKNEVILQSFLK